MISFNCTCGNALTAPDDQAGADLQCPACGRLLSVPTLSDLTAMDEDGTYKIDAPIAPPLKDANRTEELKHVFGSSRIDQYGREIDLRSHASPMDFREVGVDPLDLVPEGHDRPAAPKYDPETGELIRAVEVRPTPPPSPASALPPLRRPKQRYAIQRLPRITPVAVWAAMFKPGNLIVMLFLLIAHAIFFTGVLIGSYLGFVLLLALVVGLGLIGHFGNGIDETGPANQDELPRPLRNLNWHEDLWGPFKATLLSATVCYGPAYLIWLYTPRNNAISLLCIVTLAGFGTLIAPAVLLIAQTSGTIVNLRPDRIWNTIRGCMAVYPLLLTLYIFSVPVYFGGFFATFYCIRQFVKDTISSLAATARVTPPTPFEWAVSVIALLVGMWMINYFGWILGQTYRVYHSYFQWAYQGSLQEEIADVHGFSVVPNAAKKRTVPAGPLPVLPMDDVPDVHRRTD